MFRQQTKLARKKGMRPKTRRLHLEVLERREVLDAAIPLDFVATSTLAARPPPTLPTPSIIRSFDFGPVNSLVALDYVPVTETTQYDAARGYGFVAASVNPEYRGGTNPVTREFLYGTDFTFLVDVTPGDYDVAVAISDRSYAHDQFIFLQGQQVGSVSYAAGEIIRPVYRVHADSQIQLRMNGLGGRDSYALLNALTIVNAGATIPDLPSGESIPPPITPPPIITPPPVITPPPPVVPPPIDVPPSSRPTAGFIVTTAGYVPDFGMHPTIVSARSGSWSDGGTWIQNRVPGTGDVVIVGTGTTVSYDAYSLSPVTTVVVQAGGHLVFRTDVNTKLTVQNLLVLEQGELQIGSASNPVAPGVKAEVIFADLPLDPVRDPEGFGNGLIGLGKVTMHGTNKGQTFIRLASEPMVGHATLTLQSPATNWAVGDSVMLTDTRELNSLTAPGGDQFDATGQSEILTITAISADRRIITLSAALRFDHKGARDGNGVVDVLPHVSNLTRNVILKSASNLGTRGHALFTGRADVDVQNATFAGLGRTRLDDFASTTFNADWSVNALGSNQAGRYPVQFKHLIGPNGGQANGFQYTFEGNAVTCQMNPQPFRWGITLDDSHYGLIQNNLVRNWAGAGMMAVTGGETNNVIDGNHVSRTRGMDLGVVTPDNRGGANSGFEGVGLWMGGYSNLVRNNVVTDSQLGYLYYPGRVNVPTPAFQGADTYRASETVIVNQLNTAIREFASNEVYGGMTEVGISIWMLNTQGNTPFANATESVIRDFKAWHVWKRVYYNYMTNKLTFDGLVARADAERLSRFGSEATCLFGGGDYKWEDFVVKNADVQGFYLGIVPSAFGQRQRIENSYFRNYVDVRMETRWGFLPTNFTQPRRVEIHNCRFDRVNMTDLPDLPQSFIEMNVQLASQIGTNLIGLDQTIVTQFQGVAGDNFQVYFREQAADRILPPSIVRSDGVVTLWGAPVPGLTNEQAWNRYGVAFAGAARAAIGNGPHRHRRIG